MKKYFSILVLLVLFSGCSENDEAKVVEYSSSDEKTQTTQETQKNDTYGLKTFSGEQIEFELINRLLVSDQLNGKIVLFNFWATWCPPCKKEIPAFVELQKKYKDELVIIGVLMEKGKDKTELKEFLEQFEVNFPITINEEENFRFAKDIANVQKLPESYLFAKDGMFVKQFVGAVDEVVLESYILGDE